MSGAGFVNLHNHSHYSILDGYSRPVEYLKQAAALGQTALALTDHGNLFGAFEFVSAARAMSKSLDKKKHPQEPVWVKPIVGIEAYMAPENPEGAKCKKPVFYSDDPSKRSIDVSSNGAYTHLTLLAVDDAGFHNLIRLSTESFKRENTYYNQRMDMSMLAKWNTGLVATTGCPSGEIQTRLRLGQVKEAYEYAERMSDLFPGRYYVEIMSHAMRKDLERDAIPQLLKLAEDLKLPLLATNDAHYANPGDARRHEEMLCINTNSRGGAGERVYMDTPTEDTVDEWMETHQKEAHDYLSRGRKVPTRFAFSGNDYYLKSYEEMIRQFPEDKFPGAVRNTLEVADMVGDWWAKKPLDLEAIADKYRDDVELAKAGKAFDADYRLPHAGGGTSLVGPVKANKGVTVLGETPSQPAEFKSDPLTQKLIDDGTVALGPYDLSLNKGIRPVIQIPEGWTEAQWFQKKLNDGFVQRRVAKGDSPEILAESKRRLDVEYPVFEGNDFVQYMLVVADYIAWAREHGVTVGSGRGSVGGSEVAYLMDISRTDPIRHDLLFERFLNPERKSPPDVDTDFKASVRNDVLQYAKDKYGYDNVANIVNFGTFKLKQAFQDIAKIYHADSAQAIKMSKMIPDPIDHGEPTMEDLYDPASPFYPLAGDFREAIEAGGEQWKPIREAAGALVGRVRQTGTHACGVIMCSEPIVNYAPLFWNKNEERAKENIWTDCMCQWKYQDLEAIGLIKMDFLPLSTLDIVDSVIDNVEQYNEQIDVAASAASRAGDADRAAAYRKRKLEVPDFTDIENDGMEDSETFEMLARGESDAVFQMGSDGQKDLLKRLRPTEFDDLVAINALYRPGPMAMNAHLQYADRKNGKEPCYIVDEELDKAFKGTPVEDVLKLTYGLILFQESVQQIAQRLSGYTRGQSDSLRKAMGHKIPEEMEANHKMFVDGAMKTARGNNYKYTEEDVEKLWKIIEQFSAYAFNKSHSVSYAINAYETAYLKCHYKPFFWAANLTQNMKNKDKFRKFLRSARDMGLQVESVDVNKSGVGVTAAFDPGKYATDTITFGFDTASGVNETVAREIVASRNKNGGSFKSFDDFMTHGPESILSAGAITGLADAGAFDCLGVKRKQVADRARWIVDFYKKKRTAVASSSRGLLGMLGGRGAKSTEKSMGEYDLTRDEYSKKEGTISFGPLSYDWATMLAKEKASLGVYASADPLSNAGYGLELMKKNPSSPYRAISTLEEEARAAQGDSGSSGSSNGGSRRRKAATVRLIGYLVDLAVKRNAKGSVWFSGSVCDESGSIEFRMYSRAIQQRMEETGIGDPKTVISEDTVYDMMCSWSADTGRLTIDAVSEVPIAKDDGAVPIIIRMKGEGSLRSAKWRDVAALLSAHPGNVPVAVDLAQASGKVELDGRPARRGVNMLGARVDGSREFVDGLTALVGDRLCSWSSKGRWDPEY